MKYQIEHYPGSSVAGFHNVGPWERTVEEGFRQLAVWVKNQQIHSGQWMAIYYDNPEVIPQEKLRCDTVITVARNFDIPANSAAVIKTTIAAGEYAVARARVDDDNFGRPWQQFFASLQDEKTWQPTGKPCFEHYLNDGSESGVWEFDMYVPVERQ